MARDNYIYATAKVRALESYLMSDSDMTRVIEAKDPDIAFKAFNSLDYAGELLDLEAKDYRVAMDRKIERLKKVLEHIVPDERLMRLLFLDADYYNIKIILKEKFAESQFEEHLETAPGICKPDQLRRYIIEEQTADLDSDVKKSIDELVLELGSEADPEMIENIVDNKLSERNKQLADAIGNKFIIDLFRYISDRNNIKLFLRARRLEKNKAWFMARASDTGSISVHDLEKNFDIADHNELMTRLTRNFGSTVAPYIDEYLKDKHIWHIELGINNMIMEHLKQAKLIGYGPETVVAYFFAKKFAIQNLSTIMALKFGEIEPTEIRKQLVNNYHLA